jgi:alkylation response protein AidB-like acyl-CoA dehydrogenase
LLVPALSVAAAFTRGGDAATRQTYLPDLIAGKTTWTLAIEEANGTWGPEAITAAAVPTGDGSTLSLTGTKILVPCGTRASHFLVACRYGDGVCLAPVAADADGLGVTPMPRFDGEEMAELRFERVAVRRSTLLDPGGAGHLGREVYDLATVLTSAALLGATGALLEMTTAYAKERVQFGRPIGAFQAVSHRLADVLVSVEIGRSLLYGACLSLDERRDEASALASAAKAWTSEAAVEAAEAALQLHGGIGYTWELDVHLYLRRVRSEAVAFGDATFHRERVAVHLTRGVATDVT